MKKLPDGLHKMKINKVAAESQNQTSRHNRALDTAGDLKDTYSWFALLRFKIDNVPDFPKSWLWKLKCQKILQKPSFSSI